MAYLDLAKKFSNDMYATKKDVANELKLASIDNIWINIINYRSFFNTILSLKHITGTAYSICFTPMINDEVSSLERKLSKGMIEYGKLERNNCLNEYKKVAYHNILSTVAKKYGLTIDDTIISMIVAGTTSVLPPEMIILNRYYQCLKSIEDNPSSEIDDSILADFYANLTGQEELSEFYRKNDVNNLYSKTTIDRIYLGIPANLIDKNMEELFNFIKKSKVSLFSKAVAAFYYFYYVKPFELYNEEIAILLFKKILAFNDLGSSVVSVNFENILLKQDELESFIIESQRTCDLTYILNYFVKKSDLMVNNYLDELVDAQKKAIKDEIYTPEDNSFKEEKVENIDNENLNVEGAATTPIESSPITFSTNVAINNIPTGLSEAEASKLETHLIELDPSLSHSQAYFYARHCTINMKYTILQFKKELGCAYETARSSMDHLVYLGYYRKEMLKNKFIYTPVKKN